jgi:hypothetical protein
MGADGHIKIWRDDKVRAEWPDCDELFEEISTHYVDMLDGVKYHHCYHGDNIYDKWWYLDLPQLRKYSQKPPEYFDRLVLFANWLYDNGTEWEVWT